jgi:hypothetical protein
MASAERAGACTKRAVLRRLGKPKAHMNVAAMTSAETIHAGESQNSLAGVNPLLASAAVRFVGYCPASTLRATPHAGLGYERAKEWHSPFAGVAALPSYSSGRSLTLVRDRTRIVCQLRHVPGAPAKPGGPSWSESAFSTCRLMTGSHAGSEFGTYCNRSGIRHRRG